MPSLRKYSAVTPLLKLSVVFYAMGKTSLNFSQGPQELTRPTSVWCSSLSHHQSIYWPFTAQSSSCAQGRCAFCRRFFIGVQIVHSSPGHIVTYWTLSAEAVNKIPPPEQPHNLPQSFVLQNTDCSVCLFPISLDHVTREESILPVCSRVPALTTVPAQGWGAALQKSACLTCVRPWV